MSNVDIVLAGAAAAFTIDLLVYPLDTIKTRYQSRDYLKTWESGTSGSVRPAFRGLYQGVGSVIVATLPAAGLFFTTYESAKTFYANTLPTSTPQPLIHAVASGTAEMASCLALTPAEVIKQNAQMLKRAPGGGGGGGHHGSTSIEALRQLWRPGDGVAPGRRLLTGYTALLARNLPFTAMQFPIFEHARRRLAEYRGARTDRHGRASLVEAGFVNGLSAAASGSVAATLTTPSDVVKTRMMLGAANRAGDEGAAAAAARQTMNEPLAAKVLGRAEAQKGGLAVARDVYREKGIRGLFRGGALRAGWTALGSGLYLGTYEVAKLWLRRDRSEMEDDDGGI